MLDRTLTIESGPDLQGRYVYYVEWDTDNPPYCSRCGGNVNRSRGDLICSQCGHAGKTMRRAQYFKCPLPDWHLRTSTPKV